jgi:ankyrin repeat protein
MKVRRDYLGVIAALCSALSLSAADAASPPGAAKDPLEPARAALRTLQFDKAIQLLGAADKSGNPDAQYLLGLMYLNGVGTVSDSERAKSLLRSAAEHGQAAAAYVLAGELAHDPGVPADSAHEWLARSAKLGYVRAVEALKSGRPLLDRETVGASDPTLLTAWVIDCVRKDDAAELRRLGKESAAVRDEFGRSALAHAAEAGTLSAATALLELGADVAAVDAAGTTALMIAAERPNRAMVELLLHHGADPQAADALKRTAVFYAARANHPEIIRTLQDAGAKLDALDERGYNALDDALAVGADASASELRSFGLHANVVVAPGRQTGKFDPAHPGDIYRGWPAIALAVARNDTAKVQEQLGAGVQASLRLPGMGQPAGMGQPQGDSLLQVAADAHAIESLTLLLARGADPSAPDHAGHSVLWLAAVRGDLPVIKALLSGGVSPDTHTTSEKTPLLAALRATHPDVADALLAAGASPEAADAEGHTPLMLACASRELGLVKALLAQHAKTGVADRERRSALWYAAAAGSRDEVVMLLSAGASEQLADTREFSVLHAAAAQPDAGVLEPLLAAGAAVNRRSVDGDTPLLIAAATGHAEVVRVLLAHSPELNVQNKAGDTALIAASRGGYTTICHLLLEAGAQVGLRNVAGVSAADVATGRGFASIAKEISAKG